MKAKLQSSKKARRYLILASVGATLAVGLLLLNLATGEKRVTHKLEHLYSVHDPQFAQTMGNMPGPAIIGGNRFKALQNGDEIFPAMLAAIRGAQKTITIETYIFWSGDTGRQFSEALAERAHSGVKVHLLLDWLGSAKIDRDAVEVMKEAGVQVKRYHPVRWYNARRMNNRTHRKLLIVDGRIGFTGGVGIADQWRGHAQDPDHWRDSHFQAEGPVVAQMQSVFMDNWIKVAGEVLHGPDYFPMLQPVGEARAQMFSSSPSGGSGSMLLMYLLVINAAEKSIHLASAYFIPDELTRKALVAAARRGVKVQIITPGEHMDSETARRASRARWGDLLEAGVEIYEYQPTMFHCKTLVADEMFVSVGSTNFDPRSFGLNDEANLNVYDADFARQQIATFREDLAHAKRMTLEQWQDRPLLEKLWEGLATQVGPAL
jgi:cardiolipin synthase